LGLDGPIGPPPQLQLHGQDGRIEQHKTLQPTLSAAATAENLELICILFILCHPVELLVFRCSRPT